ncbi:MAG: hypothetical protein SGPRY_012523, partial [Prymnesium sp.]
MPFREAAVTVRLPWEASLLPPVAREVGAIHPDQCHRRSGEAQIKGHGGPLPPHQGSQLPQERKQAACRMLLERAARRTGRATQKGFDPNQGQAPSGAYGGASPFDAPGQAYGQSPYGQSPYGQPGMYGYNPGYGYGQPQSKSSSVSDKLKAWGDSMMKSMGIDEESRKEQKRQAEAKAAAAAAEAAERARAQVPPWALQQQQYLYGAQMQQQQGAPPPITSMGGEAPSYGSTSPGMYGLQLLHAFVHFLCCPTPKQPTTVIVIFKAARPTVVSRPGGGRLPLVAMVATPVEAPAPLAVGLQVATEAITPVRRRLGEGRDQQELQIASQ